ncbi:hypothetical protein OPT61_g3948 [Boeremia exigua]|uniref:Uncharacterized protein n=1 Tax=Boeremia exigua TaxID=749465 RepID=A0ACC2IG71_9PLEO|nr:hypothetical protein OPT61_g3948 [Boeremia exigua]
MTTVPDFSHLTPPTPMTPLISTPTRDLATTTSSYWLAIQKTHLMEPSYKRSTTPPPAIGANHGILTPPPSPGDQQDGLPKMFFPPSPGQPCFDPLFKTSKRTRSQISALDSKRSQSTGVQKKVASKVTKDSSRVARNLEAVANKKTIGIMDLPGELRNIIYSYAISDSRQALLVHRPRIASLRPRTRLDRSRTLGSDILEKEHDKALADNITDVRRHGKSKTVLLARETSRPFFGLTQVCRVLREEYRPLYMKHQEIGMDLTEVAAYLSIFYPDAASHLNALPTSQDRKVDMPFTGNMTIAVGEKLRPVEKSADGVDVGPLLDVWANSFRIEAGFGRYMQAHYHASSDGEAKDL